MAQLKYQNGYVNCTLEYSGEHINFDDAEWHDLLRTEHTLQNRIPMEQLHLDLTGPNTYHFLIKFVTRPNWEQDWDLTTSKDDPLLTVATSTGWFRQSEIALIQSVRAKLLRLLNEHQLTSVLCKY